jgi:hypothetical protein
MQVIIYSAGRTEVFHGPLVGDPCQRLAIYSLPCATFFRPKMCPTEMFLKLWSVAVRQVVRRRFRKKKRTVQKFISGTARIKNTPIHVCVKTAFTGWPSTESRKSSYFHNFLCFSHYCGKYKKLVYRNVVMVTLTTGLMFLLFTCIHPWVWGILRRWSAFAPTV